MSQPYVSRLAFSLALLACCAASRPAHAGRPLATDDAATAPVGSCQLEGWQARSDGQRSLTLAPACGLAPGLEVGLDASRSSPRETAPDTAGAALKWAPAAGSFPTAAGDLALGLKLGLGYSRPDGGPWSRSGHDLVALASLNLSPGWALHANLGTAHDRASAKNASFAGLALVWTPAEPVLLFVEAQANDRRDIFGGSTRSLGARWWLIQDRLGLDLTTHRSSGAPSAWSVGLGWYGLGL
ncbi:MAG: hypothetical protein KF891_07245 [Rhizobacter sp.]|nr:hypothetical protein [Rhizobacter sp.]